MEKKKTLVTGGAGFIGSNLVKELIKNYHVTVIDDLSAGSLTNIQDLIDGQKITFIKGNINDICIKKYFKDIDYVFHLAAIASVPKSLNDPIATNIVNVGGLVNVLLTAAENNVKKVVFSSSCAIYGNPINCPINENVETDPLSPYAVSKLIGEFYCNYVSKMFNLPTVSLRYFNVYGPHQDPLSEYSAVIPKFIDSVLKNKELIIYGNGEQTRDFVFVEDVVNANILAVKNNLSGIFNVGSGKKTSINDIAKIIMKLNKKTVDITYSDSRDGEVLNSYADISKIKMLNWIPKWDLENGLEKTIDWFSKSNK